MNRMFRKWLLASCVALLSLSAQAQQTNIYTSELDAYQKGLELMDQQKYVAAQREFLEVMQQANDPSDEAAVNSEYYAAVCALELFNRDAEYRLSEFVRHHPESPLVRLAYFQLGKYNYQKKRYPKVIAWFDKVDMFDLTEEEKAEYFFKLGYAHFQEGDFEAAKNALYEIKDVDTYYTPPARYYYSHIAYMEGNYETALTGFNQLKKHKKFSTVVPYYITQIYYHQNRHEDLLAYAPEVLETARAQRKEEISRLIGDSYFRSKRYEESIPYLEKYKRSGQRLTNEDKYQLGYAYYKSHNYEKAIEIFKTFTGNNNELAQTCYYHLADCYLRMDNKKFARNAFLSASRLDYDADLKENALFNYAKLSYELYDPYSSAIGAFEEYVKAYPNSEYKEEAYGYMLDAYLNTNNYGAAIESLEGFEELDVTLQEAYQQVTYNRGVEFFINQRYDEAIVHFEKSRTYNYDKKVHTLSQFWTGEAYHKTGRYTKAIKAYESFIYAPGAILMEEYDLAHFNLGYSWFELEQYEQANSWFRKFIFKNSKKNQELVNEALLRVADGYFIQGRYFEAEPYYKQAADMGLVHPDYALYQQAEAMGVQRKVDDKIRVLEKLLKRFKTSDYLDDGKFGLARAYMTTGKTDKALDLFADIIENHPGPHVKQSLLNTGLIYKNQDRQQEALDVFVRITEEYPSYNDTKEAIEMIKNICVERNTIDVYEGILANLGYADLTTAHLDSVRFDAVSRIYMERGNCEEAIPAFEKYIGDFEPGIFGVSAHFYLAQCAYQRGQLEKALEAYRFVVREPTSEFSEQALAEASQIAYDLKRPEEALGYYISLEKVATTRTRTNKAQIGQMRLFFELKNYPAALEYANKVSANDDVSQHVVGEALRIKGISSRELGDDKTAWDAFEMLSNNYTTQIGSEGQYYLAEMTFATGNMEATEAKVYELVNRKPAYEYWVAKGLILLSDVYVQTGDLFQAKATLESIVENFDGDDELLEIARMKLDAIVQAEHEEATQPVFEDTIEVMFDGTPAVDVDTLFNEELEEVEEISDEELDID